MVRILNEKPLKRVRHLARWYFGNYCAMKYGHGKECDDKLQEIAAELEKRGIMEMTPKEFGIIARENLRCKPIKREFHECPICKKFGVPQRRF